MTELTGDLSKRGHPIIMGGIVYPTEAKARELMPYGPNVPTLELVDVVPVKYSGE